MCWAQFAKVPGNGYHGMQWDIYIYNIIHSDIINGIWYGDGLKPFVPYLEWMKIHGQ